MIQYQTFDKLNKFGVTHGFTVRNGNGISLSYGNQHMGVLSRSDREVAWENVLDLMQQLSSNLKDIVITEQIHEDQLCDFQRLERRPSVHKDVHVYELKGTDGVFTKEKNVLLMTFYADCTPIYFYDSAQHIVGMVHSGWRGTAKRIVEKGISFMKETYQTRIEDLQLVIGPSAGSCCYEIDDAVKSQFPNYESFFTPTREGHYLMDIKGINKAIILEQGLLESQVEMSQACTLCQTQSYFSFRRENGHTGRMAAFMML